MRVGMVQNKRGESEILGKSDKLENRKNSDFSGFKLSLGHDCFLNALSVI